MRRLTVWFASTAFLSSFCNCLSLTFVQANKTTRATVGESATFAWRYKLAHLEQGKQIDVTFGLWEEQRLAENLLVVVAKNGNVTVKKVPLRYHLNLSYAGRIHWVGDLDQAYVAFQLSNVTKRDAKDFGCKIRIEVGGPPKQGSKWTRLKVLDPPPTTDPPQQVKFTKELREGQQLFLQCPSPTGHSVTFVWLRNNVQIKRDNNSSFVIHNITRDDGGQYTCVAQSQLSNWTAAEIRVDVQYPPTILLKSRRQTIRSPTNRTLLLSCRATGNPAPTFAWYLRASRAIDNDIIRSRERDLRVVLRDDSDFTVYTCKVSNKLGSDMAEFVLRKEAEPTQNTKATNLPTMDSISQASGKEKNGDGKMAMYLSVAAVLAVLLIGGIITFRFLTKRCSKAEEIEAAIDGPTLSLETFDSRPDKRLLSSGNVPESMSQGWELLMKNVKIEKVIGRGAFGVVSKGYVLDLPGKSGWTLVAIKGTLEDATEKEKKDLMSELQVLKHIRPHPHVIRLYGCIIDSDYPMVVVEYVPHGDLLGYLRKSRGVHDVYYDDPEIQPQTTLTSQQLVTFAWEIADGMDFLTSNKIIHRDLAARNVLVGDGETCKITDFGMARDVQEEDIYQRTTESRLPVKWTAPEALFGTGAYTTQSDVWSFGIVLYEICTIGGKPYPGLNMKDMPSMLSTGYRMPQPPHVDEELYALMRSCWEDNPLNRPTFEFLRCGLDKFKNEINREYINLRECIYENETAVMIQQKNLVVSLPPSKSAFMPCNRLYSNA